MLHSLKIKNSALPQVCIHFWDDPAAILRKVHNFNKLREKLPEFKLEELFMHKLWVDLPVNLARVVSSSYSFTKSVAPANLTYRDTVHLIYITPYFR